MKTDLLILIYLIDLCKQLNIVHTYSYSLGLLTEGETHVCNQARLTFWDELWFHRNHNDDA